MELNVDLLETSFAIIARRGDELTSLFYAHLFADYPAVLPLFDKVDLPSQKKKLLASLKLVVENLRRPEELLPVLEQLGCRHVDYGAEEAHYPAVGATLLKSMAEVAGDAWTEEMTTAWSDAYELVARQMLAGAVSATV